MFLILFQNKYIFKHCMFYAIDFLKKRVFNAKLCKYLARKTEYPIFFFFVSLIDITTVCFNQLTEYF